MSELVIVQSRDPEGRTCLSWFDDEHAYYQDDPIASVSAKKLEVSGEADVDVRRVACALFQHELMSDPRSDLAHLTTWHIVEQGGPIEPNQTLADVTGFSEDERNLRDIIAADHARNFGIGQETP